MACYIFVMSAGKKKYDVIVIGGGASGMMAAGRAAERGKSVLLLEKNAAVTRKLAGILKADPRVKDAIAFIVLLLFLLLRPQGFFGKKIRKAEV